LVVVDEAARVPDELMAALRPTTATKPNARMIYLTTPWHKSGFFYQAWNGGDEAWHRIRIPASACPRISKEHLEEELRELGELVFRSEYEPLDFFEDGETVIRTEFFERAVSQEVSRLWA
jgi:hypothetical protein